MTHKPLEFQIDKIKYELSHPTAGDLLELQINVGLVHGNVAKVQRAFLESALPRLCIDGKPVGLENAELLCLSALGVSSAIASACQVQFVNIHEETEKLKKPST